MKLISHGKLADIFFILKKRILEKEESKMYPYYDLTVYSSLYNIIIKLIQ